MHHELLLLSALAAAALAALIDSARRAAPTDAGEDLVSGAPSATLERLERARARLDEHAPRILVTVGLVGVAGALLVHALSPELAAVFGAVGTGLAWPGALWIVGVRRERHAIEQRIATFRQRLSCARERSAPAGHAIRRGAAPPPRA